MRRVASRDGVYDIIWRKVVVVAFLSSPLCLCLFSGSALRGAARVKLAELRKKPCTVHEMRRDSLIGKPNFLKSILFMVHTPQGC